jgi:phage internal scaffolding protein
MLKGDIVKTGVGERASNVEKRSAKQFAGDAMKALKRGDLLTEDEAHALTRDREFNPRGDVYFGGVSLTDQSSKDECDINNIMAEYVHHGDPFATRAGSMKYGDFSDVGDFHTALNRVMEAESVFMALDAKVRAEFENDPALMLEFVSDSKNRDRAIELGLIDPPAPEAKPVKVEVISKEPPK